MVNILRLYYLIGPFQLPPSFLCAWNGRPESDALENEINFWNQLMTNISFNPNIYYIPYIDPLVDQKNCLLPPC